MNAPRFDNASGVPDLLRRFVPAPFTGAFAINGLSIVVRSNDAAIVELLAPVPSPRRDRAVFRWKLIYDPEAPREIGSLTLLRCGPTAVANLGSACLVAVDYDRSELAAFVGITGLDPVFREAILPLLTALTLENASMRFEGHGLLPQYAALGGSHD